MAFSLDRQDSGAREALSQGVSARMKSLACPVLLYRGIYLQGHLLAQRGTRIFCRSDDKHWFECCCAEWTREALFRLHIPRFTAHTGFEPQVADQSTLLRYRFPIGLEFWPSYP